MPRQIARHRGLVPRIGRLASTSAFTALATTVVAPVVRSVMVRSGVLDSPNARSSHTGAVPRGGGLACVVGGAAGCLFGRALGFRTPWRTATGAASLAFVGFADDRWTLPTFPRLASQLFVGIAAGMAVERVWLGALTVPTLVNVVNFMDGINGITALTTAVWGINATTVGIISDNRHLELIGAVTAGSALGFLPHNLRSERIFLGDVGSYLIGSLMALVALHPSLTIRTRLAVTAPLMPYLLDTGMTLMIRAAQGKNVLEAHREHFYQRLANDQRLSHPRVASLYATGAAVIAAITHLLLKRAGDEHR